MFCLTHTLDLWDGVRRSFLSSPVEYYFFGMKYRTPCKQIFYIPFYTPSTPGLGQKVKTFFPESHDAYQITRKEV